MPDRLPFTPVIIIGAGRSGTNILRDTLCRLPGFATWDCDEINPIWRHGNMRVDHDEFGADLARPDVTRFIRKAFEKQWRRQGNPTFLIEKTCANSLRIPFVNAIFPEAKFVFILRDGFDVTVSAAKRWRGELELDGRPYFGAKIRHTPLGDLPGYAWQFLRARASMFAGKSDRLAYWGPRFRAMQGLAADTPVEVLCAHQWAACVEKADVDLNTLSPDRVLRLRYEDFVARPEEAIRDVLDFLAEERREDDIAAATADVSQGSIGKGRRASVDDPAVARIVEPVMARIGDHSAARSSTGR